MIKTLRNEKGLTLKDLSALSGVSVVTISRYENGTLNVSNMTLKNAARLSAVLECRPEELLEIAK